MSKLNIAIFGSSGAIGSALCKKYTEQDNVEKVFCFSRKKTEIHNKKAFCFSLNYLDEEDLLTTSNKINFSFDIILISIGALLNPEKSIKDLTVEKFNNMISANTLPTLLIGKYFLPKLNKNRISKFASLSARVGSISDNFLGGWYSYRASKSALNMIIKNFAIEINRTNKNSIIFGLHPGTVTSKLSVPFKNKNKNYFSPETSANYLFNVIETKTNNDNGKIFDWNNQEILP
tara:strand:+ start:324 stop:1022 length:699 start_codon:yes stop_codon:yes gene_type:complete